MSYSPRRTNYETTTAWIIVKVLSIYVVLDTIFCALNCFDTHSKNDRHSNKYAQPSKKFTYSIIRIHIPKIVNAIESNSTTRCELIYKVEFRSVSIGVVVSVVHHLEVKVNCAMGL
jgi:hypothetical protein